MENVKIKRTQLIAQLVFSAQVTLFSGGSTRGFAFTYANVDHTTNNTKLQWYMKPKIIIRYLPGSLVCD